MVNCVKCGKELEDVIDTTSSNYDSERTKNGQQTGDIYYCDECEEHTIDDHLNGVQRQWHY